MLLRYTHRIAQNFMAMWLVLGLTLIRVHALHLARIEVVVKIRVLLVEVRANLSVPVPFTCSAKPSLRLLCMPVIKQIVLWYCRVKCNPCTVCKVITQPCDRYCDASHALPVAKLMGM